MNELLYKLESFDIDGGPAESTFAMRLANEQGWTPEFTARVIREYLRFIYLGATVGPVSPSEIVDEAWHLHMIYTESYWDRMCGAILGKPFHHRPSRGGRSEDSKHRDLFGETLSKYRQAFGEEPPSDIWLVKKARPVTPRPEAWVLNKRRTVRWAGLAASVALVPLVVAGCTEDGLAPGAAGLLFCLVPIVIVTIIGVAIAQRRTGGGGSCTTTTSGCSTIGGAPHMYHGAGHDPYRADGEPGSNDPGASGQGHCSSGGHCSGSDSGGSDSGGDSGGSSCGSSCGGGGD